VLSPPAGFRRFAAADGGVRRGAGVVSLGGPRSCEEGEETGFRLGGLAVVRGGGGMREELVFVVVVVLLLVVVVVCVASSRLSAGTCSAATVADALGVFCADSESDAVSS
jgi:hypothetical protein